jgi:hypothetical protein
VFVRGRNNAVHYKYKVDGVWKPDTANYICLLSSMVASDVVAVARGRHLHVFVVDFDSNLKHLTSDGLERAKDAQ